MATGIPLPSYSIIHTNDMGNTTEITASLDKRFTVTNGKLTINNPMEAIDAGSYHCIAQNQLGLVVSNPMDLSFGCKFQIYFFILKYELNYIVNISYQLNMTIKHIVNTSYRLSMTLKYIVDISYRSSMTLKYIVNISYRLSMTLKYVVNISYRLNMTTIYRKFQLLVKYGTNKLRKYSLAIRL